MPRELVADKAKRYLTEGRVIVTAACCDRVTAVVRGTGRLWVVGYQHGAWTCTCPNRRQCTHRRAVQMVTAPDIDHDSTMFAFQITRGAVSATNTTNDTEGEPA